MQRLLGRWDPQDGRKAAAPAIAALVVRGLLVDTGEAKKPRRSAERIVRAEKLQTAGTVAHEGGKHAQPTSLRSFWWRVFRVPALTKVRAAPRRVRTVPLDRSTAGSVCVPIPPPSTADFVSTAPVEPESRLLAVGLHSLGGPHDARDLAGECG